MDSVLSLLVGPLGQSFRVFKEYGILPKDINFIEFSDDLYENYYRVMGMPSGRLFLLIPLDLTGKEKGEIDAVINQYIIDNSQELPTVTEVEKREMLKAVRFIPSSSHRQENMRKEQFEEHYDAVVSCICDFMESARAAMFYEADLPVRF